MCIYGYEEGCNEDIDQYFYDPFMNTMLDDCGQPVFEIFDVITPNQLFLFKQGKECVIVIGVDGEMVELIWPDGDDMFT